MCAVPFLLVSGLLVLGALIIVRLGVMLFPAIAVLGLFPPMRSLVIGMGNTVAAAMINAVVFGIGTAVMVKGMGVILSPTTGLAGWMIVLLLLLLTLVMWVALRPFRRLTLMVSPRHNVFADGASAPAVLGRGIARVGGRVATIAAGSFFGTVAASRAGARGAADGDTDETGREVPQRAEATTVAVAPDAVSVEAAAAAPVFVGARGPVTVTAAHSGSFDDDPAQAAQALKASSGNGGAPEGAGPAAGSKPPPLPARGPEGAGARQEAAHGAGGGQNGGGGSGSSRNLDSVPARLEELVRYHGTDARNENGNGHAGGQGSQRPAPMDDVEGTPAEVVYRPQSPEAAHPEGVLNGRRR
jgi:hypothetical protein